MYNIITLLTTSRITLLSPPLASTSTFVCPTEILAFSDRVEEFHTINTEVVACSVDSKYTHLAWINMARNEGGLKGLNLPLLSDLTKQIAKDYGVLLEDEGHTLRWVWFRSSLTISSATAVMWSLCGCGFTLVWVWFHSCVGVFHSALPVPQL